MARKAPHFWQHAKEIPPALWKELNRLPRANDDAYPCMVEQLDGTNLPCVLFVEESVYRKMFKGFFGNKDLFIEIESVKSIRPSPSKTPVDIEKKMQEHGETRMGGTIVTFVLRDGRRFVHVGGNSYEFVSVPPGYEPDDIVDAFFENERGERIQLYPKEYYEPPHSMWCVFRRPRILRLSVH